MAVRIQFRRGTASEWVAANPTLAAGEVGYEIDTAQFKIGTGTLDWDSLPYAAVSESYVDNAIANVIDLAPGTLDTLNELAAALNDDPDFFNTISNTISDHTTATTNVHGIADTSVLETTGGAQQKANDAQANAQSYTDNSIANLINGAPGTLDTLNELANALGDDANFSTTVTNSLANRIQYIANTEASFNSSNPDPMLANVFYVATDVGRVKIGDGFNDWANSVYVGQDFVIAHNNSTSVHGIENTLELVNTTDLQNAIGEHAGETSNVHGIANTADLVVTADLADYAPLQSANLISPTLNDPSIANASLTGVTSLPGTTSIGLVTAEEIGYLQNVSANIQGQLDEKLSTATAANTYAPLANVTFTGTVSLPLLTSIGNVTYDEIGHLEGVTSGIQAQLDAKLSTSSAASIYAPLTDPTFINSVTLPANTAIGSVSSTEIGYLDNVSSNIQTQLDAKAPIESPTFTGTVSGITAAMVGLDNVDNTSDLDKPVSNAVQTALDLKANLANPTFTGEVETADLTVTGNLIVQGTTTTVSANDLKLRDNMIYLNQAGTATLTNAVGDGTNVVYTTSEAHGYQVSDFVTVANTTPSSFNISGDGLEIIAVTSNTFTVASNVTDTYTSGGTTRGKVHFNPDLGWAAGRYADNTYAHAGVFRDATDGVFKFFDGYVPEPDESVFIDTAHNTFALADVAVADLTAANLIATTGVVFPDNTIQTSAGVPSLTSFTEKTASYTLDTLDHQDNVVEMNSSSGVTFTIPTNANLAWPIGASMDILQTGTGQVTIAGAGGVTVNSTPGLKLRTRWSSCTIMKRGTDSWIVYGDLTA